MRMVAAASSGAAADESSPRGAVARVVGEADDGLARTLVAGPGESDAALLARRVNDGRDPGFCGELVVAGELDGGGHLGDLRDQGRQDTQESEDGISLRVGLLRPPGNPRRFAAGASLRRTRRGRAEISRLRRAEKERRSASDLVNPNVFRYIAVDPEGRHIQAP
jgi:hypothetical protein